MTSSIKIAVMRGDGIGADVTDAALAMTDGALARCGLPPCATDNIDAGASYFAKTGQDIEPDGEARAGAADAIFLGAIGLHAIRQHNGTEISPHLRLRDR